MEFGLKKQYEKTIIENSLDEKFKDAIKEWTLIKVTTTNKYDNEVSEEIKSKVINFNGDNCICGHFIQKVYIIYNNNTDVYLINGCDCIDKLDDNNEVKIHTRIFNKIDNKVNKVIENKGTRFTNENEKIFNEYLSKMEFEFNLARSEVNKFINSCKNKNMPFGKHKGIPFINVPKSYILWYGQKRESDENFIKNDKLDGLYNLYFNKKINPKKKIIYSDSDSDSDF